MEFKRVDIGRDSIGVKHFMFKASGLPDGVSCYYSPEEADKPRGAWFVAAKNGGRKKTIRCKSEAEAVQKAGDWCRQVIAKKAEARS